MSALSPAVEARDAWCLVGGRDGRLVEGGVRRVFERRGLEALVIVDGAVANQLHLRNARDRLEVWMVVDLLVDGSYSRHGHMTRPWGQMPVVRVDWT
jgi:hypothetical protein